MCPCWSRSVNLGSELIASLTEPECTHTGPRDISEQLRCPPIRKMNGLVNILQGTPYNINRYSGLHHPLQLNLHWRFSLSGFSFYHQCPDSVCISTLPAVFPLTAAPILLRIIVQICLSIRTYLWRLCPALLKLYHNGLLYDIFSFRSVYNPMKKQKELFSLMTSLSCSLELNVYFLLAITVALSHVTQIQGTALVGNGTDGVTTCLWKCVSQQALGTWLEGRRYFQEPTCLPGLRSTFHNTLLISNQTSRNLLREK